VATSASGWGFDEPGPPLRGPRPGARFDDRLNFRAIRPVYAWPVEPPTGTPEVPPRVDVVARPSNRRPLVLMLLGLVIVAAVAIVLFSADVFGGSCSEDDLQLARQIPPYGGAQLEFFDDPEGPGCATQLQVEASATEVLDHYAAVLEDEGWEVSVQDTPVEGPEGLTVADLVAVRGDSEVTIALESFGGQVSAAIRVDA
jgi:hypothetical protein